MDWLIYIAGGALILIALLVAYVFAVAVMLGGIEW